METRLRGSPLPGRMMVEPLSTISILRHAAQAFPGQRVVARGADDTRETLTYASAYLRVCKLANALREAGILPGDRVATLAASNTRHFELYYAVSGLGAVCHTLNPRFAPEALAELIRSADDRMLFVDPAYAGLLPDIFSRLAAPPQVCVLADRDQNSLPCYEGFIAAAPDTLDWPRLDETVAAMLVHTSGTTGLPKGVLYSHRSIVLHALANLAGGVKPQRHGSVVMPLASMYHVTAWGHPFLCPMVGANLVLPGPRLDPAACVELIEEQNVTLIFGVPTLLARIADYMQARGRTFSTLRAVACGGAPAPLPLIRELEALGLEFIPGWGMTEVSPTGAAGNFLPRQEAERPDDGERLRSRMVYGVSMRIVAADGKVLPHDGVTRGELQVRGNWVANSYWGDGDDAARGVTADGWFQTGDIATIDPEGRMLIVDRLKDLIKSGGEWISSVEIEQAAQSHPGVAEAAAIAMPDPRWIERPLLVVQRTRGAECTADEIRATVRDRLAHKWWVPDRVVFVDAMPHASTGKIDKASLRRTWAETAEREGGTP